MTEPLWELQVIGLSATVGNPAELLRWLQGSGARRRPAHVIAPDLPTASSRRPSPATTPAPSAALRPSAALWPVTVAGPVAAPPGEVELDYVGSVTNAAKVLAGLKFNTALPPRLAEATLATRLADLPAATTVLREPVRFTTLET